jgi:hypothetical protein
MKQKIGVVILILTSIIFTYLAIMLSVLTFGIIVAPIIHERGIELVTSTTNEILKNLLILTLINSIINYIIFKKLIGFKKPIIFSFLLTAIGILISIPFYISARNSFMDYADSNTKLFHYINVKEIREVSLIAFKDTIKIEEKDKFISEIGSARYKPGTWKYMKKIKINMVRTDGKIENIDSNGELFGSYKGKYFSTENNLIEKYFKK